jgi:zinc transport system substrate-binding protein
MAAVALLLTAWGDADASKKGTVKPARLIVASDTLLSGMMATLLPPERFTVEAILPPGQCPGHYDIKLSDVEKTKKADLIATFKGMPFMEKAGFGGKAHMIVDTKGRNWMAPASYIDGLEVLASEMIRRFPEEREQILKRKQAAIGRVESGSAVLMKKIKGAGIYGKTLIASDMQKEPLEGMGFKVLATYGRAEALSARDVVRLVKLGKDQQAAAVVDNLQSGPDTGKGIAETLGVVHVVLTNFPSEKGYLATLSENVDAVATAMKGK